MEDAINALYRRIYIYNIHTAYRTASLIIGYSFHDLFPFLSFGTYEASFLFFTTHRSFVFVWTVSVDCHSLGQPLEFAAPNVISNARLQIRKEYEKEQKGKGKLRREERDKKDTIFLFPKKNLLLLELFSPDTKRIQLSKIQNAKICVIRPPDTKRR